MAEENSSEVGLHAEAGSAPVEVAVDDDEFFLFGGNDFLELLHAGDVVDNLFGCFRGHLN